MGKPKSDRDIGSSETKSKTDRKTSRQTNSETDVGSDTGRRETQTVAQGDRQIWMTTGGHVK